MNNIIHEIATKIGKEIAENMETTLIEGNNISEFILKTKKCWMKLGLQLRKKHLKL